MNKKLRLKILGTADAKVLEQLSEFVFDVDYTNEVVVFCDYAEFDIPTYHTFNTVTNKYGDKVFNGPIILRKITQQFAKPLDVVPQGWKTICVFHFEKGNFPEVINHIPVLLEWHLSDNYLYFS